MNTTQYFASAALLLSSVTCTEAATVLQTGTFGTHTYKLIGSDSGSRLTWPDAQAAALALGGNLVTVNDEAENTFLLNTFGAKAISAAPSGGGLVSLWLGLNDAAQEGQFVWADGTSSSFTNWKPGEPAGNVADEDFIGMVVNSGFGTPGQWHDIVSDFRINDVTFGVVEIVTTVSATECLFNWAETNYASLFSPAGAVTQTSAPYTYRYYKNTNAYVGISSANNDVYYLGPDGSLLDVGSLSGWLAKAKCQ